MKKASLYPVEGFFVLLILSSLGSGVRAQTETEKRGDILQIAIPALSYGATYYLNDQEGRNQFHRSFFTNLALTYALKNIVKKERPDGSNHQSFPSGHTSAAFQGAGFVHKRYGPKYAFPAYMGAVYVAYSRVHADKHFVEDVVAGAVLGLLCSFAFTEKYPEYQVTPTAGRGFIGVTCSMDLR